MNRTTPYERSILAHYFCMAEPWKKGNENWNELDITTITAFIDMGLLIRKDDHLEPNHEALQVYMDALSAVPLPVKRWVIPEQDTR